MKEAAKIPDQQVFHAANPMGKPKATEKTI